MKRNRIAVFVVLGVASPYGFGEPWPDIASDNYAQAIIHDYAFQNSAGRIAVNQSAGNANAQSNLVAIAVGANSARTRIQAGAGNSGPQTSPLSWLRASIEDQAFSQTRGLVSVNQVSGTDNIQLNGFAVAVGLRGEAVNVAELALISSPPDLDDPDDANISDRRARMDATTFRGSQGFVQINQVAGDNNRSANTFAFQFSAEAQP